MRGVMRVEDFHVIFAVRYSKVHKSKSTTSLSTLELSGLLVRLVLKGSMSRVSMRNICQVTKNNLTQHKGSSVTSQNKRDHIDSLVKCVVKDLM